jgi:hypothetical protein
MMRDYRQTANEVAASFTASYWLKDAAVALDRRDPCDAYADVLALLDLQRMRLRDVGITIGPEGGA